MREAREGRSVALWLLVVFLAVACAVGGMQVAQAHDARARDAAQHARYAAALDAATTEATAFVNVTSLRRDRTVTVGEVVWAGVVRVDTTSASVLVATEGTRADRRTKDASVERDLRLRLRLVSVDGVWLTSQIELVE